MQASSERWKEITRSEFPWEQEVLEFVRERLPDREPYRAWANFEFIADDGSINEVDLLVLTPRGFFLVAGRVWSRATREPGRGSTRVDRSQSITPLLLTNRKAKRVASLLRRPERLQQDQPAIR
jgi:hypothetical protein